MSRDCVPAKRETSAPFPVPPNEAARLDALRSLNILDTEPDERFDRIARLAAAHFRMPVVRITFIDEERSWYKSCIGPKARQTPREMSICSHAIMEQRLLLSHDLAKDPRFAGRPQVRGEPYYRFYAGAPLTLAKGLRVGSLCILDYEPHPEFGAAEAGFLMDLAEVVVHELELHRQLFERDDRLRAADEELVIAKTAKERFMAIVSHELRTPLNGVLGFGELIAKQVMGPIGQPCYVEYAEHLCESASRLQGLIERVLTYASADEADLQLLETVFAWRPLLDDCLRRAGAAAAAKNITIELVLDEDLAPAFYGDEVQVREMALQLLDNAIAFSEPGKGVRLGLSSSPDGGCRLWVEDRGPGIAAEELPHVMTAFSQSDESLTRPHEGLGLGLPITKALADRHGGRLLVQSPETGGTLVQVFLPASRLRDEPRGAPKLPRRPVRRSA